MPDPKNKKTKDTLYTWNGRQVNKRFSDSISFQRKYANKIYEEGKKDFDFDKIKRGMNLMPGPGILKKKFEGGQQTTTYNMSAYKMEPKKKKIKTVTLGSGAAKAKSDYDAKVKKQMEDYQNKKFEAEFAAKAKMSEKKMYGGKQYTIISPTEATPSFGGPRAKSKGFQMSPKGHGGQAYPMIGNKDPKKKPKMVSLIKRDKSGKSISNIVGCSGLFGYIGGGGFKAASKIFKAFSNTPKQYIGQIKKYGFKKTKALRKQGITDPKSLQYADKSWTASKINKNVKSVPVVGKPGKTVKVPKSSKTKQVSYVNPRISMTAAERAKAGY